MKNDIHPIVAIHCMVYNHGPFLRQCLDGFVMQQTDFPFIAIVHDDVSSDNSVDIIREYAEKYPNIICPIFEQENQFAHPGAIARIMLDASKSAEYIAFCEGDDFWTDQFKLQRQVDFLKAHSEYSFCCHRFCIYEQNADIYRKEYAYDWYREGENLEITKDIFMSVWVTQMLTTMVRRRDYERVLPLICELYHSARDNYLFYELLMSGRGISLNKNMGVYRWNNGGIASSQPSYMRYKNAVSVYNQLYEKHPDDQLIVAKLRYNYERLLRYTRPSKEGKKILKESFAYCETTKQKLQMTTMFLIPPSTLVIPVKIYRYFLRKKCFISNPS